MLRPLRGLFEADAYPDLIQGLETPDDAAVWRLDGERALVLTADFFPPVVDDPFTFGAIAAANALSDLYAMGARPLLGINLVGFPEELDPAILAEILRGGGEKMREAGAVIAGGHTTTDPEPKYGVAVIGLVHPDRVWTKGGARAGDALFLTKPLGTGLVTTACKRDACAPEDLDAAAASMARLNAAAADVLRAEGPAVHAATDVTGFGLAGHALEMAEQGRVALHFRFDALELLPGAERHAREGISFGGLRRNRAYYEPSIEYRHPLEPWQTTLLFDPQTSGGLLAAVDGSRADAVASAFAAAGVPARRVGQVAAGPAGRLVFV